MVSASEKLNQSLPELFSVYAFSPVCVVSNVSAAKRMLNERDFDFLIINSPLPDDVGLRFALDAVDAYQTVVLFLTSAAQYDDAYEKLVPSGVFLLKKPVPVSVVQASLSWLISARERVRKTEKKTLSLEEKMEEIRLVNRAKWLLIRELHMKEPDAHRYLEKQAMDRCVSKRQIAEEIIKTYA